MDLPSRGSVITSRPNVDFSRDPSPPAVGAQHAAGWHLGQLAYCGRDRDGRAGSIPACPAAGDCLTHTGITSSRADCFCPVFETSDGNRTLEVKRMDSFLASMFVKLFGTFEFVFYALNCVLNPGGFIYWGAVRLPTVAGGAMALFSLFVIAAAWCFDEEITP